MTFQSEHPDPFRGISGHRIQVGKTKTARGTNTTSTVITTVTVAGTTTINSDYEGWDEQPTRVSQNTETLNQLQCCSENTVALLV